MSSSVTRTNVPATTPFSGKEFVSTLCRPLEVVSLAILYVAVGVVVFDAVLIMADVFGRVLLGNPILGTVELVRNTVVLIIFCQAPATIMEGRMLRVSALLVRLPPKGRRIVEALTCVLGFLLFVALAVDMWQPMINAWQIHEMDGTINLKMPLAPVRTVLIALWLYTAVILLYALLRTIVGAETSVPVEGMAH